MDMKVVIGLGNPGAEYAVSRHNAGMMLVEVLGSRFLGLGEYGWRKFYGVYVFKTTELVLVKTANYFMNESGNVIRDVLRLDELQTVNYELFVAHDDLDLKVGEHKIQMGKGPKEHNGVKSVEQALGTKEFWRIRIGVDNRQTPIEGETYVLQKFLPEERQVLSGVLDQIVHSFASPKE